MAKQRLRGQLVTYIICRYSFCLFLLNTILVEGTSSFNDVIYTLFLIRLN